MSDAATRPAPAPSVRECAYAPCGKPHDRRHARYDSITMKYCSDYCSRAAVRQREKDTRAARAMRNATKTGNLCSVCAGQSWRRDEVRGCVGTRRQPGCGKPYAAEVIEPSTGWSSSSPLGEASKWAPGAINLDPRDIKVHGGCIPLIRGVHKHLKKSNAAK